MVNNQGPGGLSMQNAGVRERVQRLLEQHSEDERVLDAYWQWATNPTPPAAGYALEENAGFIATNLHNRYGEPAIELVAEMETACTDLRQEASIFDLQQAVLAVLHGPVGDLLRQGVLNRLHQQTPARRVLAAWLVARTRWTFRPGREAWIGGEFDWALGIDLTTSGRDLQTDLAGALWGPEVAGVDLVREALATGIINRLFYRSAFGRMEPKIRPGPRIPVAAILYT